MQMRGDLSLQVPEWCDAAQLVQVVCVASANHLQRPARSAIVFPNSPITRVQRLCWGLQCRLKTRDLLRL